MTEENRRQFESLCAIYTKRRHMTNGIGTLGEKGLHAVIKAYCEPDPMLWEQRVGRYVADICRANQIIEVQTGQFAKLRGKLEAFLHSYKVTVVYPIPQIKWLCWVDGQTGEVSRRRKSPKTGAVYDVLYELYKIKPYLGHTNLRLRLLLLELEEYRLLNGWSQDRKRGSHRHDRLPLALCEEYVIAGKEDYSLFVPSSLPALFTSKDFRKHTRLSPSGTQAGLNVLASIGAVRRVGKKGRYFLYERVLTPAEPGAVAQSRIFSPSGCELRPSVL